MTLLEGPALMPERLPGFALVPLVSRRWQASPDAPLVQDSESRTEILIPFALLVIGQDGPRRIPLFHPGTTAAGDETFDRTIKRAERDALVRRAMRVDRDGALALLLHRDPRSEWREEARIRLPWSELRS